MTALPHETHLLRHRLAPRLAAAAITIGALAVAGCGDDPSDIRDANEAQRDVEEAAEDAGNAIEDVANDADEAANDVAEGVDDAIDEEDSDKQEK